MRLTSTLHHCFILLAVAIATAMSLPVLAASFDNIVIISVDALAPDGLGKDTTPFLSGLMKQGLYSLDAKSVDPPLTLVSHSAMMTGLSPKQGGRLNNNWTPGEPTVGDLTIFHRAKTAGYRTGFFYAKEKLGYLVNSAVDKHRLSGFPTDEALRFVRQGNSFTFVHISGLDQAGLEFGWLSKEYLEELAFIDEYLRPLVEEIQAQGDYCVIILSDHGGHERLHGCGHPEDYRIPLIVVQSSPVIQAADLHGFTTNDLFKITARIIEK